MLKEIKNDDSLKYVYYYGEWYPILKAEELSKNLLKTDIRHIRDNEYILTNEIYNNF